MAPKGIDRLQYLFLDAEEPRRPHFSTSPACTASPDIIESTATSNETTHAQFPPPPQPAVSRSLSNASTTSSSESSIGSVGSSGSKDSASSNATSISRRSVIVPAWVQQMATPFNYGYMLPCEFFFVGCELRFDPSQYEAWISHSMSHFVDAPLPPTAICTFCDANEATFHSDCDDATNWRERMIHIGEHLEDFTPSDHMRPDFWVIEHMCKYGLISADDYAHALKGTERPSCKNLYPLDYEIPETQETQLWKERNSGQRHNLAEERKQMKKEEKKGNGKSTHGHSHLYQSRKVTILGSR